MSDNPMGSSLSDSSSLNLIKIGILLILLAWGMRGIISSFAQYGVGNMHSEGVLSLQIADDAADLAQDEELYTAGAETSAELAELQQRMEANSLERAKLYEKMRDDDTSDSEAEKYDEQMDDLREKHSEMEEKENSLELDLAEISDSSKYDLLGACRCRNIAISD